MTGILLALCAPSLAATVTVGPDGDFASLDEAVHESADGDTILVNHSADELVVIDGRQLDIQGMSPEATVGTIRFLGSSQVSITGLAVRSGVEIEGGQIELDALRFEGQGQMSSPALTVHDGFVSVSRSTVADWEVSEGSPVQLFAGELGFDGSTFLRTGGTDGGALRVEAGELSVTDSSFESTKASGAGGAISATGGRLVLESTSFSDGQAVAGGFVAVTGTSAIISRCSFERGVASEDGGMVTVRGGELTMVGSTMSHGSAARGGSVSVEGSTLELQDVQSSEAVVSGDGGHYHATESQVRMRRVVTEGGAAARGGGFYQSGGDARVENTVWSAIEWAEIGGAWYQASGTLRMDFSTIERNAAAQGAGIASEGGTAQLDGLIVSDNKVGEGLFTSGSGEQNVRHSIIYGSGGYESVGAVQYQTGTIVADPRLKAPEVGEWMPASYSPALDAGPPGQIDPDGSAADMGAYGGPHAWTLQDSDRDGYPYGRDCDDESPSVHEYAEDAFYDGVDHDCRGNDDFDADADGHAAAQYGGDDCDDTDATRNPSQTERNADAFDSDCDGLLDEDLDGDGWAAGVDCDDQDASVHPWADDEPYDGVDSDCVGDDDWDADGDGWRAGADCDDADPSVAPDAAEIVDDGIDQDCDGEDLAPSLDLSEDTDGNEIITPDTHFEDPEPNRAVVTLGCASTPTSSGFAAALFALAGSLLLRRRD